MEFNKGDKVQVANKQLKTYGRIGTVYLSSHQTVQVNVNGVMLTYKKRNLKLISNANTNNNKGDSDMLMGNYRVCKIKFIEGVNTKCEYYYALYDNNIRSGDHVVVKSAHNGFGLAVITEIVPDHCIEQEMVDFCNGGREVVTWFDMSSYEERVENRKKAKQIKADMDKKVKEMQELVLYEMMAEKNPELKQMLDTYKELTKC